MSTLQGSPRKSRRGTMPAGERRSDRFPKRFLFVVPRNFSLSPGGSGTNSLPPGSHRVRPRDPIAPVLPEGDAELSASLFQTGAGIPASPACVAAGRAADRAPFHLRPTVPCAEGVVPGQGGSSSPRSHSSWLPSRRLRCPLSVGYVVRGRHSALKRCRISGWQVGCCSLGSVWDAWRSA